VGNGGFEVFKIDGDMHIVLDEEFFKVALVGCDRGMHGVFENLLVVSVISTRTSMLKTDRSGWVRTFTFHNLCRKTGKHRLSRVRVHIKLLCRQAKMLNNLLQKSRVCSPLVTSSASVEDSVLN
jgi:hypothetical protein